MKLLGRSALITGAGKGLGKEIAKQYVQEGASVFLCSRTRSDLEAVQKELEKSLVEGQHIAIEAVDVSDKKGVDALFEKVLETFPDLSILVNNAGIYGPFGPIEDCDWAAWKKAFEINVYGTVYPSRKAVEHFKKRGYGKVVNLSGGGATNPLPRISAYAASKAAVVRFVETLALEVKEFRIDVNAIAPGALATQMTDLLLEAGPDKVGSAFYEKILKVKQEGGTPLEKGARLAVYLGAEESDGITGKLISAVWDPWNEFHESRDMLESSDIYTLRRIVPEDRNVALGSGR